MKSLVSSPSRHRRSGGRPAIGLIIAVVMTVSLVAPASAGTTTDGGHAPGVSANPALGPLSASWWQWLMSIPKATNPNLVPPAENAECGPRQSGPVVFLAGSFGPDPVIRKCTVPRGKPLFFPLLNIINVATDKKETAASLWRDLHVKNAWTATSLTLVVNGRHVLKKSPPTPRYRGCAGPERGCWPSSFAIVLPKDPVFLEPGLYRPVVADGYYVLLPPLSRGKTTITFGGTGSWIPDPAVPQTQKLGQSVTYVLTVK